MRQKIIGIVAWSIFLYPIINLQSCSSSQNHILRSEISGKGLLNLDLSNPYLAPNKFLSEEAKTSETLKGFLSLKGAPESLEFSDPLIGMPSLKLVYKNKNEVYVLEERGQEWIINGPTAYEEVKEKTSTSDQLLMPQSSTSPALLPSEKLPSEKMPLSEKLEETKKFTKTDTATPAAVPAVDPKASTEEQLNQKPSFKDVYHEVTFPGQTLSFITYWYTGNIMNSDRVRRINSSLKEVLKNGDIVRIPSYIAQNDAPPSPEDLQKFSSGVIDKSRNTAR